MLIESRRGGSVALTWTRTIDWDIDDWRDRAECKDTDPDLFFPVGTTGQAIEQIEAAKAVCFVCAARTECLEFALANQPGIRGVGRRVGGGTPQAPQGLARLSAPSVLVSSSARVRGVCRTGATRSDRV